MISFSKPTNLNGSELIAELEAAEIVIAKDNRGRYIPPFLDGSGILWLPIEEKDSATAQAIVAAHNGTV